MFYFLHISKCAGSTFVHNASRNVRVFPSNANGNPINPAEGREFRFWNWTSSEQKYLLSRSTFDFIANETFLGKQFTFFERVTYITILRDPLDRILSHFLWLYRDLIPASTPLPEIGDHFAKVHRNSKRPRWSENYMLSALTVPTRRPKAVKRAFARLEVAKERLQSFDHVFFVETLDQDFRQMRRHGWRLKPVRLKKREAKVPTDMRAALASHPDILADLLEANRAELELYEFARSNLSGGRRRLSPARPPLKLEPGAPVPHSESAEFFVFCAYDAYLAGRMDACRDLIERAFDAGAKSGKPDGRLDAYVERMLQNFAAPLRKQRVQPARAAMKRQQLLTMTT